MAGLSVLTWLTRAFELDRDRRSAARSGNSHTSLCRKSLARRLERVMAKAFLRIYPNHPDIGLAEVSIGPDWAEAKP